MCLPQRGKKNSLQNSKHWHVKGYNKILKLEVAKIMHQHAKSKRIGYTTYVVMMVKKKKRETPCVL